MTLILAAFIFAAVIYLTLDHIYGDNDG